MYNTARFSRMPKSELPGTRMKKPQIVGGTSLHGDIVPLFCNLVMPGTIDSCFANGQIWMSTPIAPIMSQIKASINVFYVPMRLVWKHTKEFFGENKTTSGPQTTVYTIPRSVINDPGTGMSKSKVKVGSVSHYLGKPLFKSSNDTSNKLKVSVLKERAYWLVWSEYYRMQQVQNPFLIIDDDGLDNVVSSIGSIDGVRIGFDNACAKCLKDFDYFTTGTISPNFGGEVLLPLGSIAPIVYSADNELSVANDLTLVKSSNDLVLAYGQDGEGQGTAAQLYADLSLATAAKIDELYTAMAAQAFYHNANYGSRYFEMLQIHYGVSNPDLVLDRPEHVSEFKFDIIVQDVVSQAGATADSSTKLGQPGAVSKTIIRKKLYNHSFGEWGFVIALMNTYHQRYYSAGVLREDLYSDLFDFYFPEFANRGDDSIFDAEVFAKSSDDGLTTFAYQEAYADRRYYQARATGQLDPYCAAAQNGKDPIGRWILAEKWSDRPSFSAEFLTEDRGAISQALVSGENGPDYVWDFNFVHTEILPMPAYSKPGIPSFGRGIV